MQSLMAQYGAFVLLVACGVAFLGGLVKGMVGFALPAIMISGLASFMSPELALAGLIMPTLATNGAQSMRQGGAAAWQSIKRFRLFLIVGAVMLVLSAQLFTLLSVNMLLLGIGLPIVIFSIFQLSGWRPKTRNTPRLELGVGAVAGFVGGLSGVWGPPTVAYLTAIETPKQEQLRIQGVIYGLGAVALFLAHLNSGVIRAQSLTLSVVLIVPAMIGLWVGFKVQDRINQTMFRTITLWVLLLAGLNLVRRGVF